MERKFYLIGVKTKEGEKIFEPIDMEEASAEIKFVVGGFIKQLEEAGVEVYKVVGAQIVTSEGLMVVVRGTEIEEIGEN